MVQSLDTASLNFVFFGLLAALLSNVNKSAIWRSAILMVASLVFIGFIAHSFFALLPFIGFLALGYIGVVIAERWKSAVLPWMVGLAIFTYIWLKKYTFLPDGMLLHGFYFTLGLSYVFFRVLHLMIETGQNSEKQRITPLSYLLYTLNFTTFISGPIQRYDDFVRDQYAAEPIGLGIRVVGLQLERLIRGFFKVNVLALVLIDVQRDALAKLANPAPTSLRLLAAIELAVVYPFFLYCNFSGYIDIVIALARLMRIQLPENFDRPFSACSFLDFWNRWHITLSTWLKTYVYNPVLLALMRRVSSKALQPLLGVFSFFVTFFLVGVWHGRTSEFLVFGILQGAGVAVNKLWQVVMTARLGRKQYVELGKNPLYVACARGLTFSWFAFTLFWFWGSWQEIALVFNAVPRSQWLVVWAAVFVCATVGLAMWERLRSALLSIKIAQQPMFLSRYARVVYASALGMAALVLTVLLNQPAPDIVYKGF
jgi:D-alanyl-lipoteichoic acid acyltransferase DltB (MBOAT superfamily)